MARKKSPKNPPEWMRVGARVDYHSTIGGPVTQSNMLVSEEPWLMFDRWVVMLAGKSGCVAVEALSLATATAADKVSP